jgi:tetrapyrrole methylase family protein/MazG family protein
MEALISLVAALRTGCPWDRKQTARSMSVYLVEETHELVEAIREADTDGIREELGDVLFHILFVAQLFKEQGRFDIQDVINGIHEKMVRRHPHVFGQSTVETVGEVKRQWRQIKNGEKNDASPTSPLDSVPAGLPGLMRAYRICERAAGDEFAEDSLSEALSKVDQMWHALKGQLKDGSPDDVGPQDASVTFGDLLFALTNVARMARIHPEMALGDAILAFKKRFSQMKRRSAAT